MFCRNIVLYTDMVINLTLFAPWRAAVNRNHSFKLQSCHATHDLHANGTYTGTLHMVPVPLSHCDMGKYGQSQLSLPAKQGRLIDTESFLEKRSRFPTVEPQPIFTSNRVNRSINLLNQDH